MTRRSRLGAALAVIIALSLGACDVGGASSTPADAPASSTAPSQAEQPPPDGPRPSTDHGAESTPGFDPNHGREVTIRDDVYTCSSFWGSQQGCPLTIAQPWNDHADNLDRFYLGAEQGAYGQQVKVMTGLENWKSVGYHAIYACRDNFTYDEFRLSAGSDLSGLEGFSADDLKALYSAAHETVCPG